MQRNSLHLHGDVSQIGALIFTQGPPEYAPETVTHLVFRGFFTIWAPYDNPRRPDPPTAPAGGHMSTSLPGISEVRRPPESPANR